jgi:hypothetical protein
MSIDKIMRCLSGSNILSNTNLIKNVIKFVPANLVLYQGHQMAINFDLH